MELLYLETRVQVILRCGVTQEMADEELYQHSVEDDPGCPGQLTLPGPGPQQEKQQLCPAPVSDHQPVGDSDQEAIIRWPVGGYPLRV